MSEVRSNHFGSELPRFAVAPSRPPQSISPIAAKGFRPFFLASAFFAALILPIWLLTLAGVLMPITYFDAMTWHAHEMLFGFTTAVVAGFLLTAVGNWTGKETLVGKPLLAACAVWAAGRIAMATASTLPRGLAAMVDLAFLPVVAFAIGKPLAATKNRRNFVMIAVLALLWTANLAVHLDALGILNGLRRPALAFALDLIVFLMIVITSRILPMFTRNGAGEPSVRNQPALDKAAIAAMALTTLITVARPDSKVSGVAAGLTAILVAVRARTWGGQHTLRVPLLWILHAGHAWIVVGLALRAVSSFAPAVPSVLGTHALTVGAIGALTVGMMARVTLGHTGRMIVASRSMTAAFGLITLAAFVRVVGPLLLGATLYRGTVFVAGGLWTAAFALLAAVIAPLVIAPRIDGKPG